ncbi:uncharacterized protein LOC115224091 isoform X1 [Argonauta hians]
MAWYNWSEGDSTTTTTTPPHHQQQQYKYHRYNHQHYQPQQKQQQQHYRACGSISEERMHYLIDSVINVNTDCYYKNHHLRHYNHFWHPQRPPLKSTLVLFPPSWDTITQCWKQLADLGLNFSTRKRLILYFVFRGTSFKVCLGDAKAAGLLCVLGIGLGIGSLLIYRLFKKYQCSNDLPDKTEDECYVRLESVDSVFHKEEMGHGYSSQDLPAAHYTPDSGVSFLLDSRKQVPSQEAIHISETPVRNRKLGPNNPTTAKDCCKPDIATTTTTATINNTTTTVDPDDMKLLLNTDDRWLEGATGCIEPHTQEDDCSVGSCPQSFTSSLIGNYSPRSLRERNLVIDGDSDQPEGRTSSRTKKKPSSCKEIPSPNKNRHKDNNISKNLKESSVLLTPPSEEDSPTSPYQSPTMKKKSKLLEDNACHLDLGKENDNSESSENYLNYNYKDSPDDFDNSLFSELSFSSKSLSPSSCRDWSLDDEEKDLLSPLCHSASFDQFPQMLMRRLRECKSVSPESNRSRTPDDCCLSPDGQRDGVVLERCDSIDSSIFEIINDVPKQIEKEEGLRFHGIEDELQDLNDEMDDLMSGLSHLKSKCSGVNPEETDLQRQMLLSEQAYTALQKAKAHCAKRPGSLTPDSSAEGDLQSPTDNLLSWDMADFQFDALSYDSESNVIGVLNQHNYVPFTVDSDNNFDISTLQRQFHSDNHYHSTTEGREDDNRTINVGPRKNIQDYAKSQWRGDTPDAHRYLEAYHQVQQSFECKYIRVIRGDNYCGIRSCVVQLLINGIAIKKEFATADIVKNLLNQYMEEPEWELNRWTFARRLNYTDVREMMFSCIDEFYTQRYIALHLAKSEREAWVEDLLNREPVVDIKMMETAKLLMFLELMEFHKNLDPNNHPLFVQLILSRDTSETPACMINNILNAIGDTRSMEQIDMCLLGHALGVQITVPRLYRYGREDFILKFPDLPEQNWDKVFLITEDDRHYNIIISDN